MTEATEIAMNLADVKLRLRKLAGPYSGKRKDFDAAVQMAINGLNGAIIASVDAVHAGISGRRQPARISAEERHEHWRQKQIRDGSFGNLR